LKNKHLVIVLVCLTLVSLIAVRIDIYNQAYAACHPKSDAPVFMRFLGEGRSIVSSLSVLQADRYYHGGIEHLPDEHGESCSIVERNYKEHKHHEEHVLPEINPFNILFHIYRAVGLTEHVHLHGDQMKEIIPWLYYASEIDPHNTQAYTLTGYYLCDRLDQVDQGIVFLREGLRKNPDSWEINAELGRIYFQYIKNYEVASKFLSRAWNLIQKVPHDKVQERYVLSFLAASYEFLGRPTDAIPIYKHLNKLFPEDVYKEKIANYTFDVLS